MDCLVALLPSEIARLVYGYLLNEKCSKAAKSFLDESPNLHECRKVAYNGRPFTTRVSNWSLLDILEAFCQVNYIVQETADKFNRPDKLKHSNDLISKIQFLLEIYACYQTLDGDKPLTNNVQNPPSAGKLPPENEQCTDDGSQNIPEKISQNLETDSQRSVTPNSASCTEDETVSQDYLQTKEGTQKPCLGHEEDAKSQDPRESPEKIHQSQPNLFETDNSSQKTQLDAKNLLPKNILEDSKKYVDSEVQTSLALLQSSPRDSIIQKLHKCTQSEAKISDIGHCTGEKLTPTVGNPVEEANQLTDSSIQVVNTLTHKKPSDDGTAITQNKSKSLSGPKIISIENFKSQSLAARYTTNIGISLSDNQVKLPSFRESFRHPRIIEQRNQMQNVVIDSTPATNKNLVENIKKQDDQTKDKDGMLGNDERTELSDSQGESRQQVDSNNGIMMTFANNIENNSKNLENEMCIFKSPLQSQKCPPQSDGFFSPNNTLTSTPLKPLTHQNFDISNWFSTQINTPITVQHKDTISAGLNANYLYAPTINKTAVTSSINAISPIISTATSQIDETIPNVVSTNVLQGPSLPLAKGECSPGNNFSRNTNLKSPISEKRTPLLQKNSREVVDLLNTPNVPKSSESTDNPSPVSRSTSELNKILGLDSIMLYGMDNNATSLQIPLAIQEIEMEDSITFTGTGLSPFLKKMNTERTDAVPDEMCNGKTEYKSNRTPSKCLSANTASVAAAAVESCAMKNSVEISQKKINIEDVIKYNTPQSLLENRTRNKRSSFTSPKKTNSCVRALDFDKNFQQCMSDGKAQDQERFLSPTSMKRELMKSKACKTSLFQSPPYDNSNADDQKLNNVGYTEDVEIPLSTETSECATETGKEKTGLNDDVISKRRSSSKENDENVISHPSRKDVAEKKSWDSDLRRHLCIPEPPPSKRPNRKRNRKKPNQTAEQQSPPKKIRKSEKTGNKTGKNKKKTSSRKEKDSNQETIDDEKEDLEINESSEISQSKEMGSAEKERDSLEMILSDSINNDEILDERAVQKLASKESENLNKLNGIDAKNTSSEKDDSGIAEKMPLDEESLTTAFKKISDSLAAKYFPDQVSEPATQVQKGQQFPEAANVDPCESTATEDVVYAKIEKQLKEITGSGGSSQRQPIYDEVTQTSADGKLVQKKYARVRTLKPGEAPSTANCLLGLEDSPRKDEDSLQVPPTPRVLSPGSSMLVMPLSKHSEDSHTLASFVATTPLECPLTPGIVLTPPKPAPTAATGSSAGGLAIAGGASSQSNGTDRSQSSLATFKVSNTSEITKFGVIQENLFKPNKEPIEPEAVCSTAYVPEEPVVYRENETIIKTDATSTTSSYCRTSCTGSSSNATSSSSEDENNNGSDSEEETQRVVAGENHTEDQEYEQEDEEAEIGSEVEQENGDRDNDTIETEVLKKKRHKVGNINDSVSKIIKEAGEISPTKILAIDENNAGDDKIEETPAKDDFCQEVEIFETPNVAKSCENRTNLNDKISEMMIIKEREVALGDQNKLRPKIKNMECDVPKVVVKPQFECPSKMQTRASSIQNNPGDTINQRIKFEKSEDEIAKAIESITVLEEEKIRQVQEDLEMSVDSCNENSPYKDDTSSKKELVRAIESITRMNYGAEDSIDDSSGEAHLKVVLVDEGGDEPKENESKNDSFLNRSAEHCHNTRFKSRQKGYSNEGNSECKSKYGYNKVYDFVYEDNEKKKKRRKGFSDSELISNVYDDEGRPWMLFTANKFDEIFAIKPARKKPVRRAAKNTAHSSDEDDEDGVDYGDNDTADGCNSKDANQAGSRRKRRVKSEIVPTKKRRQKSIYVY